MKETEMNGRAESIRHFFLSQQTDDVVRYCLPLIFHGMNYKHFEAYAFKFTKDAEMEIDNGN